MNFTWQQYVKRQARPGYSDDKPKQVEELRDLEEQLYKADMLNWGGINDAGVAELRSRVMAKRQVLESMTYVKAVPPVTKGSTPSRAPAALDEVLA